MQPRPSRDLVAVAQALATDQRCAEVIIAWRAAGIEPILLKGPTLAEWLYPGEVRSYVDADLLVAPSDLLRAAEILGELGYRPFDGFVSLHAHPWLRPQDGGEIDLHANLWGPGKPPERVWSDLQPWLETTRIAGVEVRTLGLPARALYVTLHAAQHRDDDGKPGEDLRRALARAPGRIWQEAEILADRLGVLGFMAKGLAREPEGLAVIDRLPLVRACLLAERGHAPLAIGLTRFALAPGPRAKVRVVLDSLARPPDEYGPDRPTDPAAATRRWTRVRHAAYLAVAAVRTLIVLRRRRGR
jgi:hypothetical protein